jgi:NAD-dependent DNA ligase
MFNAERGTDYANCRTAIIGLFGRSDAYKFRDYITLIPLAVDRKQVPQISNRIEEIEFGNNLFQTHGEPLRYMYIRGNVNQLLYQIDKFVQEAFAFREYVDFMFDGVVVSYLDEDIRTKLGRVNYINKYSMAIKFNPLSKLTIFLGYTYEVGQDGRICPMIHYNAVEFFGTIHTKSTGSGLSRFNDLHLKIGDVIKVTYVNDVMPYVDSVDCEHNRNNTNPYEEFPKICPVCGSELMISSSGKTAFCPNIDCDGKVISRMSNMLQKMNVKGFAESTIRALGVRHFVDLMYLTYDKVALQIGPVNASNFIEAMDQIKNGSMFDYILVGSLGFTGVATNTWKLIFSNIKLKDLIFDLEHLDPGKVIEGLCGINGIGFKTAQTIVNEYSYYREDLLYILHKCQITHTLDNLNLMSSKKEIRFTGCRDLQLSEQLIKLGYDADGKAGVTKNTDILIVPYKGFSSVKVSRVSKNCKIIPIQEFKSDIQKYLE